MALTPSGSKCEWCGRSFDGNTKPCSEASDAERRVTASTTTDHTSSLSYASGVIECRPWSRAS